MESTCLNYLFKLYLYVHTYISYALSYVDSFYLRRVVNVFVTLLVLATGRAQIDVWMNDMFGKYCDFIPV